MDYLAVDVVLSPLRSDSLVFLSDGLLVVWLMDSTLWMVAYRYVSAPFPPVTVAPAPLGTLLRCWIYMEVDGLVHESRGFPRMDPAAFPCPCPSVAPFPRGACFHS